MSRPYPTYAGACYRLALRCAERQMKLRPDPEVTQTVGYWLGVTANRHDVRVHSFVAMSNHIHLDVSDPRADLSHFLRDFKGTLGRALNAKWEISGYFWEPPPTGKTRVTTYEDAVDGMAYTIANPVQAGLVASPRAWPGLISLPQDLAVSDDTGRTFTFDKPGFFFRSTKDGGKLPDSVTWRLTPHPLGADDPEQFVADVQAEVKRIVEEKRQQVRSSGGRFMGVAAMLRRSHQCRPKTAEATRKLNPRIACKDRQRRLQLILEDQRFVREHGEARRKWLKGEPAVFPAGTFLMRDFPGVTVRDGPAQS